MMMRFMSASSSASSSTASLSWRKNTHGKMVTSSSSKSSSDARKRDKGNGGNKKSLRVFSRAVPADARAFMDTLPDEKVTTFPRGAEAGWKVHKFGGTCVGSSERISGVCDLLIDSAKNGNQTFAVVSAMGVITKSEPKVTDCLINATTMAAARSRDYVEELEKLREKHTTTATDLLTIPKEFDKYMESFNKELEDLGSMLKAISIVGCSTETFADFVVGHGELWTARLTAAAIRCKGGKSYWIDAREILVVTEAEDGGVDVDYDKSNYRLDLWNHLTHTRGSLDKDTIVVCTGFIASTPEGFPTTLKRNGSDYSATIFGALLVADDITIWTDVDGVYSSDPRRVKDAVCLERLSYNEAWELAYFGANVLHPRTTLPAMKYSIPICIRNYFNQSAPGTLIAARCEIPADESKKGTKNVGSRVSTAGELIKGITTIDDVCLITVEGTGLVGVPGFASAVFSTVRDANCNVVMISQASSEHSICFAVRQNEADKVVEALNKRFEKAIAAGRVSRVVALNNCSILSAVGQNMANVPGVSAMLFTALASAAVNVIAISQGASEYNITVVIKKSDCIKAVNAVHSRFYASRTPLSVGIVGPGLVGKTLLAQMQEQKQTLLDKFGVDLRVVAISGGSKMHLAETGGFIDLDDWENKYSNENEAANFEKFTDHVEESNSPNQVIIDCSASDAVALQYKGWLSRGIHVVTPNKKANSGPYEYYKSLRNIQRDSYTHYFYEATVGAGLPIISTVKSLEDAGDDIKLIQGIFSGTLSYIFNTLTPDKKFSDVVAEAKANGYTEPDPRDDLSGVDVARKVTILARECGLSLELSDIPIESLVPEPLQNVESVDEFMQKLPDYDHEIAAKMAAAEANGNKLIFVGVVDVENKKGSVQLKEYPKDHPFAQLKGSDNIISYISKRYTEAGPLVVRGPGAGAEVTAGGVFADVLRVCAHLGAPS
jgi:aspartokinase/homoserine dehydrogenase 1